MQPMCSLPSVVRELLLVSGTLPHLPGASPYCPVIRTRPITTKSWPRGMLNANSSWRGLWQPQYRMVHMLQRVIPGKRLCATGTYGPYSLSLAGSATLKGALEKTVWYGTNISLVCHFCLSMVEVFASRRFTALVLMVPRIQAE